ncbi:MAG TPA: HipA family kinase [Acidobacteriaceae bacterium]|nr:HipA family kinase [Acidobacteriaceae bacterium]
MPLRTVNATRYVLALREGGSLPAIVEADDLGMYVVKFRGAGQGTLALVAELVAGEIGRVLGLSVPEIVLIEIDAILGRNDPDAEIRHLLKASVGLNLALDYLPGSTMFDPAARDVIPHEVASMGVWFDAFVQNVDRTPRNANLLCWHREVRFIDHGAALYFHHNWETMPEKATSPFAQIREHILLPWADDIAGASRVAHERLTAEVLRGILALVPDEWLVGEPASLTAEKRRAEYVDFFVRRLAASEIFEEEVLRARSLLV